MDSGVVELWGSEGSEDGGRGVVRDDVRVVEVEEGPNGGEVGLRVLEVDDWSQAGPRLTRRDLVTLQWVREWTVVTVSQVDRWWRQEGQVGLHGRRGAPAIQKVRDRLAALRRLGLLSSDMVATSQANVFSVTRAGLQVAGRDGWTVPRWSPSLFHHEWTALNVALRQYELGREVWSERRQRFELAAKIRDWRLELEGPDGVRTHFPDMWMRPPGGGAPRAIEVELSRKALVRLDLILEAYRKRGCGVTYYTSDDDVAKAVTKAAVDVGLLDLKIVPVKVATV